MQKAAQQFQLQKHWPEAIVVSMQGLVAPIQRDPTGARWVFSNAPSHENRDLKFFKHVLDVLSGEYKVDPKKVYSTGQSNGGFCTDHLWSGEGARLAAIAPVASFCKEFPEEPIPVPIMHIAGREDPLVPLQKQLDSLERNKPVNQCEAGKSGPKKGRTFYPSKTGNPIVTIIHPGGHEVPEFAGQAIAKFFQRHQSEEILNE